MSSPESGQQIPDTIREAEVTREISEIIAKEAAGFLHSAESASITVPNYEQARELSQRIKTSLHEMVEKNPGKLNIGPYHDLNFKVIDFTSPPASEDPKRFLTMWLNHYNDRLRGVDQGDVFTKRLTHFYPGEVVCMIGINTIPQCDVDFDKLFTLLDAAPALFINQAGERAQNQLLKRKIESRSRSSFTFENTPLELAHLKELQGVENGSETMEATSELCIQKLAELKQRLLECQQQQTTGYQELQKIVQRWADEHQTDIPDAASHMNRLTSIIDNTRSFLGRLKDLTNIRLSIINLSDRILDVGEKFPPLVLTEVEDCLHELLARTSMRKLPISFDATLSYEGWHFPVSPVFYPYRIADPEFLGKIASILRGGFMNFHPAIKNQIFRKAFVRQWELSDREDDRAEVYSNRLQELSLETGETTLFPEEVNPARQANVARWEEEQKKKQGVEAKEDQPKEKPAEKAQPAEVQPSLEAEGEIKMAPVKDEDLTSPSPKVAHEAKEQQPPLEITQKEDVQTIAEEANAITQECNRVGHLIAERENWLNQYWSGKGEPETHRAEMRRKKWQGYARETKRNNIEMRERAAQKLVSVKEWTTHRQKLEDVLAQLRLVLVNVEDEIRAETRPKGGK